MQKLHTTLIQKYRLYYNQYQTKHCNKIHWGVLAVSLLFIFSIIFSFTNRTNAVGDVTSPTVSIKFPVNNLAVAGTISFAAIAADNVGVAGVQFELDGSNIDAEDKVAPYAISWDTSKVSDGSHTLTATARDAAGNTATSAAITVKTDNVDNTGDYYDNRDGNHARLNTSSYPNVTYMTTGYGEQYQMLSDKVVIGNSSTAYVSGDTWGSNVRVGLMRSQHGANAAYNQYVNNNAYWYPEHKDHDETDYYFTQTPAVNNSQGSSGSEMDEMDKWFKTLTAFKPGVKELLREKGLLMPAIQMIARRTRVVSDNEYLSGKAHPNAFDNFNNTAAMVKMASDMESGNVPPMVKLAVVEDGFTSKARQDFFEYLVNSEKIYDTPVSIARAFRGREYTKRIVVSAAESFDANNRPLSFHWKVLRGDPAHVKINPLNQDGSKVEVLIDYHSQTVIEGSTRNTNLVSIGAFVNNGIYYSAPAFVTSYTFNNEVREYDSETKHLLKTTYNSNYADPTLTTVKSWESDAYQYDSQGVLTGWVRMKAGQPYDFTKEGYLVVEKNLDGKINKVSNVNYTKDTAKKITWQTTGQPFEYGDLIAPTVSITSPLNGADVSGIIKVSAQASDNIGVVGVQFKLNQFNQGAEDTSASYEITMDTKTLTNAAHGLYAVARDAAGNRATSSMVSIKVNNNSSDLNQDNKTDQLDFDILKSNFGKTDKSKSDINQDGLVDAKDLGILMSEWGNKDELPQ